MDIFVTLRMFLRGTALFRSVRSVRGDDQDLLGSRVAASLIMYPESLPLDPQAQGRQERDSGGSLFGYSDTQGPVEGCLGYVVGYHMPVLISKAIQDGKMMG